MSSFKADADGNFTIVDNDLIFVDGADEVVQMLRQELRFFFTEWFLDLNQGVPYYEEITVKNPNLQRLAAIFKDKILSIPGVLELISFDLTYENPRELHLSFQVRSTDGIITFNEVLP